MEFRTFVFILFTGLYLEALALQILRLYSLKRPVPENVSDMYGQRSYARWKSCQRHLIKFSMVRFSVYYVYFLTLLFAASSSLFRFGSFGSTLLRASLLGFIMLCCYLVPACKITIQKEYGLSQQNTKELVRYGLISFILAFAACIVCETCVPRQVSDHNISNTPVSLPFLLILAFACLAIRNTVRATKQYRRCFPIGDQKLTCELRQLAQTSGASNVEFHKVYCVNGNMDAGIFRFFRRKVIIFDATTINSLDNESICAIAAHELGHAVNRHIASTNILKAVCVGCAVILGWSYLSFISTFSSLSYQLQTVWGFRLLLEILIGVPACIMIMNKIRQIEELKADIYASKTKYGNVFISALKRSEKNVIHELNPHPLLLLLTSDYPSLSQRIVRIEKTLNYRNQISLTQHNLLKEETEMDHDEHFVSPDNQNTSKDNKGEIDNIVILNDQDGNEIQFEFLDIVECDGRKYLVLLPLEDADNGQVAIFRIEGDGEDETYIGVDSVEEAEMVFKLFREQCKDDFNFLDEN